MPTSARLSAIPDPALRRRWITSRILFGVGLIFLIVLSAGIFMTAFIEIFVSGFGHALIPIGEDAPDWVYPLLAYGGYFVLPAILFLPVLLLESLRWRDPRRIVVFRRFNVKDRNRAVRRIATRYLAPFGHVFTLSDQQIRRSWFARIPALFGQLSLLHFRPRNITSERRLATLRRVLGQRVRLNLNWLVSFRKIFPVRSSDEYWKACVQTLLEHADLVVMEVSEVSEAMSWELHECQRRDLLGRTVLLADGELARAARSRLAALWPAMPSASLDRALFYYRRAEPDDVVTLEHRVAEICAGSNASAASGGSTVAVLAVALNLTVGVALLLLGIVAAAPYVWPFETARYSPFKSQIATAYFVTGDPELLSGIVATDREWTLARLRRELKGSSRAHYASNALRDLGNERDIPLLVQYLGREPPPEPDESLGWFRWFTPSVISRRVDEESLRRLAQRLGDRALVPLVSALATVPNLAFDGSLFSAYIQPASTSVPDALFKPMLTAPSQAGRFTAAFILGDRRNIHAVPVLLEMVRTSASLSRADGLLRNLEGTPGLRAEWLDPYILGDDDAAERAARLAILSPEREYADALVERVPVGKGKRLMTAMMTLVKVGEKPADRRAHTLLARVNVTWRQSLLSDADIEVQAATLLAGAEQADRSIVPQTLTLASLIVKQQGLLGSYDDYGYEEDAAAILDLLRVRLRQRQAIPFDTLAVSKVTAPVLASLIKLTAVSGDARSFSRLLQFVNLDLEVDRSALRTIGETADAQTLHLIVRAMPKDQAHLASPVLSGIEDGLIWREGLNWCAIVAAERRPDLTALSDRCR